LGNASGYAPFCWSFEHMRQPKLLFSVLKCWASLGACDLLVLLAGPVLAWK
jgi:hypothetical protein